MIVVHMAPTIDMLAETVAKNEVPQASVAGYYDGAWDLPGGSGLVATDSVLAVRDAAGNYVDAVAMTNSDGTTTAAFLTSLSFVQSLGLWLPADCAGVACTESTAQSIMVSHATVDTTTGTSLRKSSPTAPNTAMSWSAGASSWGADHSN